MREGRGKEDSGQRWGGAEAKWQCVVSTFCQLTAAPSLSGCLPSIHPSFSLSLHVLTSFTLLFSGPRDEIFSVVILKDFLTCLGQNLGEKKSISLKVYDGGI